MSVNKFTSSSWWCLLFILALVEENGAVVKRDTTLDNVKAVYNRFVSLSTGKAKYVNGGKNACSMDVPPSVVKTPGIMPVAASKDDFQSSLGCGVCLKITGSGKPSAADLDGAPPVEGTLDGIVVDQDDSLNQGDLALLPPKSGSGLWEINFKAVDCPTGLGNTGFIQFRLTGSNELYFKLQATNAKVPVAGIEAFERVKGRWFCLTRTTDNFFTSEGMGAVSFPLKVRLTSIMNEKLEATVDALKNDVAIKSDIQFSDSGVRGGSPEGIQCFGQGERKSSGEGDEAFCVAKEDGIYADSIDETAFYICKGEKATKKFCPTGLKFNPMISACDVPEDVRFVENEAEAQENSKGNTRWKPLPGNAGLKVLSVGGPEKPQKDEGKTALQTQTPHKIFAINIFKAPNVKTRVVGDNNKGPSGLNNDNTIQTRFAKANSSLLDSTAAGLDNQQDLKNLPDLTRSGNLTIYAGAKTQLDPNSIQPVNFHHAPVKITPNSQTGTEEELKSDQIMVSEDLSASWKRPDSFVSPGDKNQSAQVSDDISPHKLLAINVFGLHQKVPSAENHIHRFHDNSKVSKDKKVDPASLEKEAPLSAQKAPPQPLSGQGNDDGVLHIPNTESDHNGYQQQKQNGEPENKAFQDEIITTNSGTSSPLHFKLKVNMDQGGTRPVINCTLSECSENNFAILDDKDRENGVQQQQQNGSLLGSSVQSKYKYRSQEQKDENEFHITLNTAGSDPLMGLHMIPVQGLPQQLPFEEQKMNNQSELEDTSDASRVRAKSPALTLFSETNNQLSQHNKDNTETPLGQNHENLALKAQNNVYAVRNDKEDQELKQMNEAKTVDHHEDSAVWRITNTSSPQSNFPVSKTRGIYSESSTVTSDPHKDKNLKSTYNMPIRENNTGQKEDNKVSGNNLNTTTRISQNHNTLTNNILAEIGVRNQTGKVAQNNNQNDLLVGNSQPQLKIILKSPGKMGTILNSGSQLRRRSGARVHIVQILKSLIDKPLNLGKSTKDVKSRLYDLIKKTTRDKTKQSVMESIKDSGSIAESILEANKEYLDDMAMQGLVFSDGNPESETLNDIADTIKQGNKYLQKVSEFPQWENLKTPGKSISQFHRQGTDNEIYQDLQSDKEQDDDDEGSSSSGMGEKNNSVSTHVNKHGKFATGEAGKEVANQSDDYKEVVSDTIGPYGIKEVNAYKGGVLKSEVDPRLKSFCIGKESGIYTNPFNFKSFLICSNGVLEERECPERKLFNPKEKICDLPDDVQTEQRKTR